MNSYPISLNPVTEFSVAGFLWFTGILEDSFYVAAFSVFLCLVHGFISRPVIIKIRRGILFIDCGADAYADGNTASVQFPGAQKYFFADTFHKPDVYKRQVEEQA